MVINAAPTQSTDRFVMSRGGSFGTKKAAIIRRSAPIPAETKKVARQPGGAYSVKLEKQLVSAILSKTET